MNANITYNYNYKQPSFLQSMLYGAVGTLGSMGGFGSLTGLGGYGCLGGGMMNMGMGGFGMGGSIFPFAMSGFGCGGFGMGYGCDTSDKAVVSTLGTMAGAFGIGALIQSIGKKKTTTTTPCSTTNTKTQTKTVKTPAQIETEAKANVDKTDKGKALTKAKKNKSDVTTYTTNMKNAITKIDTINSEIKTLNTEIGTLQATIDNYNKETDETKRLSMKSDYDAAVNEIAQKKQKLNVKNTSLKEQERLRDKAIKNLKDMELPDITTIDADTDTEIIEQAAENALIAAQRDYDAAVEAEKQALENADGQTEETGSNDGAKAKETENEAKKPQEPEAPKAPSAKECIDALNKVDGNSLTRAIDGKDSGNDQLDALKDAISRFENNPSKVTKEDINQLMKFIDNDGNIRNVTIKSDSREDTNAALEKVKSWINSNKNDIELLNKVLNDTKYQTTNENLDSLVDKGFGKKFDTNVSGTKKTVYKIGDKVFEKGDDNNAIELSKKKNINILRKAEYEKKNNATT